MRSGRARACWTAAALLGGAAVACAADAKPFFLSPQGQDSWLVIDPATTEPLPGGVVRRMWTVTVQRKIIEGDPPTAGYVRTQSDYDCVNRQVRWRTFSAYSRSGALLLTRDNPNPGWREATSAADIYAAYRVACEGALTSSASAESIGQLVITLISAWDRAPQVAAPSKPLLELPGAKPDASASAKAPGGAAAKSPTPAAARPAAKAVSPKPAAKPVAPPAARATPPKPVAPAATSPKPAT